MREWSALSHSRVWIGQFPVTASESVRYGEQPHAVLRPETLKLEAPKRRV